MFKFPIFFSIRDKRIIIYEFNLIVCSEIEKLKVQITLLKPEAYAWWNYLLKNSKIFHIILIRKKVSLFALKFPIVFYIRKNYFYFIEVLSIDMIRGGRQGSPLELGIYIPNFWKLAKTFFLYKAGSPCEKIIPPPLGMFDINTFNFAIVF